MQYENKFIPKKREERNGSMNVLRLNLYIVHYLLYRDSNISVKVATREKKSTLLSFSLSSQALS